MARRHAHLQNAFSKGEIDPLLWERTDLKHYYNGLKTALNVEMLPQGGFRRRPGTASLGRLRRRLEAIALTAGMLGAPNGGTAANLIDGTSSVLTTGVVGASPFVIATVDLGSPQAVCFIDALGFTAQGDIDTVTMALDNDVGGAPDTLRVRIDSSQVSTSGTQVRLTLAPPAAVVPNTQIIDCFIGEAALADGSANFVRAPTRVTFGGLKGVTLITGGSQVVSDIIDFALDETKELMVSFNLVAAGGQRRKSAIPGFTSFSKTGAQEAGTIEVSGYSATVTELRILTKIETGFFAASNSISVQYEDTPGVWVSLGAIRDIGVTPRSARFGGAPAVAPVKRNWRIVALGAVGAAAIALQELRFWKEGTVASPSRLVPYARSLTQVYTAPLTQDNLDIFGLTGAWLGAAGVVAPAALIGSMGWLQSDDAALLLHEDHQPLRVVRQGADDEWNWDFPTFINVPDLAAPMAYTTGPRPRLMSQASGWPGCGAIVQSRLILGGFRTFPKTWAASQNGSLFDFQLPTSPALATDAIVYTFDTDQVEKIRHIAVGTHLSFLTDTGEWYAENRLLSATDAINMVRPTGNGCMAGVAPVMAEGGLLFLQAGSDDPDAPPETQGSVLRHFVFGADASQSSYSAEPLSLLGPHLLTGVTAMAWRRARKTDEGGLVLMPNVDGSMAVMTFLRAQEVVSLAKHTCDGSYRSVSANVRRDVHVVVERTIAGQLDNWLERRDGTRLLDASILKTLVSTNIVTGLAHLEGRTNVWAIAGGNAWGPFTVTGGAITLPLPVTFSGTVEVGLFFPVTARTLPLRPQLPDDVKFRAPGRCFRCVVSVVKTGGFALSANGAAPRVIVTRDPAAGLTDMPMLDALFTGEVVVEDLEGWTDNVEVEISQPTPAPLTVRSLRMEVAY